MRCVDAKFAGRLADVAVNACELAPPRYIAAFFTAFLRISQLPRAASEVPPRAACVAQLLNRSALSSSAGLQEPACDTR